MLFRLLQRQSSKSELMVLLLLLLSQLQRAVRFGCQLLCAFILCDVSSR